MFGELPKILDRNFAIGYLLPASVFVLAEASFVVWMKWWSWLQFVSRTKDGTLELSILTYLLFMLALVLALGLLVLNYGTIRLLEGYFWLHPPKALEKSRFRRLDKKIEHLESRYRENPMGPCAERILERRGRLLQEKATRFPNLEKHLLPSAFGNTIRAFEVYSGVVYGLDAIPGWERLVAIVPRDHLQVIDSAKAEMDVWVNTWLLSSIAGLMGGSVAVLSEWRSSVPTVWLAKQGIPLRELNKSVIFAVASLVVAYVSTYLARGAAKRWGSLVKATFDVFLPALRKRLGFPPFASREDERSFWTEFSKAFIYRSSKNIPGIVASRKNQESAQR